MHSISRQKPRDVHVIQDVMVTMRDGVRLATDVYRPAAGDHPAEEPLPVLLERTPYDKSGTNPRDYSLADPVPRTKPEIAVEFARAGYVVVIQDCRGRYNSEGVFTKYLSEAADGLDTVAWIKAQPWCDGKIGTYGLSYCAHTQMALACLAPPGLAAMFLESGGFSSAFHSGIRQGGAFELKQVTWAHLQAQYSSRRARDREREKALVAEDLPSWFRHMPWSRRASPLRAAPEYENYLFEQWENGTFGPYWETLGIYARGYYGALADVPMVHMTGWYDPYARTITENYVGLSRLKHGPVKMVMGPWTHGRRSDSHAGDVDFGTRAPLDGNIAPDYVALRLAWFDRHLKGKPAPDHLPKPVKIFVMGGGSGRRNAQGRLEHGGVWRDEDDWPLGRAQGTLFYLTAAGGLDACNPAEGARSFVSNPDNPVSTVGGAVTSGEPFMRAGAYDQNVLGSRDDVLVFQTGPLDADVEITGPIRARLFVSSDAPDADIVIKLMDVYPPSDDWPEGFAMNLSHGILRLRYRDSFRQPAMMTSGEIYEVEVEAFPTANLFVRGHRIRLDIAGSNFPHFDINPNSGEPESQGAHKRKASITIHVGEGRSSHLVLPVVSKT